MRSCSAAPRHEQIVTGREEAQQAADALAEVDAGRITAGPRSAVRALTQIATFPRDFQLLAEGGTGGRSPDAVRVADALRLGAPNRPSAVAFRDAVPLTQND